MKYRERKVCDKRQYNDSSSSSSSNDDDDDDDDNNNNKPIFPTEVMKAYRECIHSSTYSSH